MLKISRESEINLVNVLIDNDIISGKDLINIKKVSSENNKSQIESIFELKLTDEQKIINLLIKEQNLETIDLKKVEITDEVKTVLPSNYIKVNFVAPFKIDGKTLHIAIPDSSKLGLMRNLKAITKKNIELHAAKITDISEYIERLSSETDEVTIASIRDENRKKIKTFESDLGEAGEVLEKPPEEDIEAIENESEVIKFSTAVVAEAIKMGVSDIHIEPYRFSSRVRYRLDGMLQEQEQYKQFLHDNYGAVVTRFKIMGKLDIAERRLPQDGAINFKIDNKVVDLRLSILPTASNERIVMRILNKDAGDITLDADGENQARCPRLVIPSGLCDLTPVRYASARVLPYPHPRSESGGSARHASAHEWRPRDKGARRPALDDSSCRFQPSSRCGGCRLSRRPSNRSSRSRRRLGRRSPRSSRGRVDTPFSRPNYYARRSGNRVPRLGR